MKLDPRHAVAITSATEHFTAIFAGWMLETPQNLEGADPRLKTLWLWHSAEETEHRCIAFDLYRALGGNEKWRRFWFRFVTVQFLFELMRQTVRNLWDDKALFSWTTWRSAASMMLGKQGLVRYGFKHWRAYFSEDFHPSHQDGTASEAWLRENEDLFRVVSRSPA
jgi:predicted metal-dependent hydrolase